MKSTYFCKTDKSLATVGKTEITGKTFYAIQTLHSLSVDSTINIIQQIIKDADINQVSLVRIGELPDNRLVNLFKEYGFTDMGAVYIRKPFNYNTLMKKPFGVEYVIEDRNGNYKTTAREYQADFTATTNIYGERLSMEKANKSPS